MRQGWATRFAAGLYAAISAALRFPLRSLSPPFASLTARSACPAARCAPRRVPPRHGRGYVRRHRQRHRRVLLATALRAALVAELASLALAGCAGCGHRLRLVRRRTPCVAGAGFAVHRPPHCAVQSCPHKCGHFHPSLRQRASRDCLRACRPARPLKRHGGSDLPASPASIPLSLIPQIWPFRTAGAALGLTPHAARCRACHGYPCQGTSETFGAFGRLAIVGASVCRTDIRFSSYPRPRRAVLVNHRYTPIPRPIYDRHTPVSLSVGTDVAACPRPIYGPTPRRRLRAIKKSHRTPSTARPHVLHRAAGDGAVRPAPAAFDEGCSASRASHQEGKTSWSAAKFSSEGTSRRTVLPSRWRRMDAMARSGSMARSGRMRRPSVVLWARSIGRVYGAASPRRSAAAAALLSDACLTRRGWPVPA